MCVNSWMNSQGGNITFTNKNTSSLLPWLWGGIDTHRDKQDKTVWIGKGTANWPESISPIRNDIQNYTPSHTSANSTPPLPSSPRHTSYLLQGSSGPREASGVGRNERKSDCKARRMSPEGTQTPGGDLRQQNPGICIQAMYGAVLPGTGGDLGLRWWLQSLLSGLRCRYYRNWDRGLRCASISPPQHI